MTEDIEEIDDDRVTSKLLEVKVNDCDDNGLKGILTAFGCLGYFIYHL